MVDRRGELRFLQKADAERLVLGELDGQQLERDLPLEPQILREVDDAHAAETQQRLDPVAGELRADPRVVAHLHVRILTFAARGNDTTLALLYEMGVTTAFQDGPERGLECPSPPC